jgi:hypothetical protein
MGFIFKFWMFLSGSFIFGLTTWAIFYLEKTEHQIPALGIVGAIITALTSVITVTLNNKKAKERELELLIVKEKQKAFEHFYNAYFEIFRNIKKDKSEGLTNKASEEMLEFKRGLMNWGSEELIQNYLDFDEKLLRSQESRSTFDILKDGDKFIKDLRKEMGFHDSNKVNIMSIILTSEAREELKEKLK